VKTININRVCVFCDRSSMSFILDANKVRRWQNGEYIQDVFPELTPNEREMLISSVCPKCWETL
jgi:hypothetical protein